MPANEGFVPFRGYRTWYHVEDTEGYVQLLDGFLSRVEERVLTSAQQS